VGLGPVFQGRPYIADTGLYDCRARFYHPLLMGFLQPDPLAFSGSWSQHGFDRYNPINYTDPYGAWLNVVAGAVIGGGIGVINTALSGGDAQDMLVAFGAGAVGGALTACGMPVAGAAIAGGIMGSWSGGRFGYERDGLTGAAIGAVSGGVLGAGIGVAAGAAGSKVGNAVGTRAYGVVFNYAARQGMSGAARSTAARVSAVVAGGYIGGVTGALIGNEASTAAVDTVTGKPITLDQIESAALHSIAIDGPLGAVGAVGDRMALVANVPRMSGQAWSSRAGLGRNLGVEGELLVARATGYKRTGGTEAVNINGRRRFPDFPTAESIRDLNAVIEVKNKAGLTRKDVAQIGDFAALAAQTNGDALTYYRPGMDPAPLAGIRNIITLPIPQQPFVLPVPFAFAPRTSPTDGAK
jgi:RHS repeat-associated protein